MNPILAFVAGAVFGVGLFLVIHLIRKREAGALARELVDQAETEKVKDLDVLMGRVRDSFGALSLEALQKQHRRVPEAGQRDPDPAIAPWGKGARGQEEAHRPEPRGHEGRPPEGRGPDAEPGEGPGAEIRPGGQPAETRGRADGHAPGDGPPAPPGPGRAPGPAASGASGWPRTFSGCRASSRASTTSSRRPSRPPPAGPDYTFPLPQGRKVNMDVKFPLDNYVRYLEAERDADRETLKAQFLRDVKARIKEVTTRDYINPEENTLDYVLVFIPNEQVYAFINENDPTAPRRGPAEQGHPLLAVHALRHPGHHPPGHGQLQPGGDGREHAQAHGDVPQAMGAVRPVHGEDGEETRRGPVRIPGADDDAAQPARSAPPADRGAQAAARPRSGAPARRSRSDRDDRREGEAAENGADPADRRPKPGGRRSSSRSGPSSRPPRGRPGRSSSSPWRERAIATPGMARARSASKTACVSRK